MKRRPGRPKLKEWQRVLRAVERGAQSGLAIAKGARVPRLSVHPTLNRARSRGYVTGGVGALRLTAAGRRAVGLPPPGPKR